MCRAHRRGIGRETWNSATELAAAERLISHLGMSDSIWASASVSGDISTAQLCKYMLICVWVCVDACVFLCCPQARDLVQDNKMLFPPFGYSFSEAFASNFKLVEISAKQVTPQARLHPWQRTQSESQGTQ